MPDSPPLSRSTAASLIAWYEAMGVDVALEEAPVDRLSPRPREPEPPATAVEDLPSPPPPVAQPGFQSERPSAAVLLRAPAPAPIPPSDEAARAARDAARAANTLEELRETLTRFEGCNLRLTAKQLVFADGNPEGRVMLVGEAPGRDEDLQGLPFVGRSGQLLDRMLASIGLARNDVYIANVVPWRPPGNRTPTPQETATCRPFVQRQIELADPDFLILLGAAAAREILETPDGILKLRGRWREYGTGRRRIRALATLHPAYLLRQPLQKRLAWRDLMMLKAALAEPTTG